VTAITILQPQLNLTLLQSIIDSYLSIDDVFSTSFLQTLFIQTPNGGSIELGSGVCEYLERYGTETILAVTKPIKSSSHQMEAGSSSSGGNTIPSGPYFYSDGNLYKAYRLYVDELSAFMFGTYTPDGDIYYDMVGAELPGDTTPTIAIPSRLYYEVTEAQPLAGLRLAVKNIIDVKWVKSSCESRAYYRLYDKPAKSASALKALLI
jgi:hypothetical protein